MGAARFELAGEVVAVGGPGATPRSSRRAPERFLVDLDEQQRAVVTDPARRLAVLAGPGSGKTRTLSRRVAYRVAMGLDDPERVLVTTFSRRAAKEVAERLAALGVHGPTVTTLHGLAAAALSQAWRDEGTRPWGMARYPLRLLVPLVAGDQSADRAGAGLARLVAAELSWAAARDINPEDYAAEVVRLRRPTPLPANAIARIYAAYRLEKQQRRVLDVDDLLGALRRRLADDPAFAERLGWRYRHVAVDEAQDLSRSSFRLIRALVGDQGDLVAVGDPDQAVYGFAGADARILSRLSEAVDGLAVRYLTRAHRCPPGVLAAARRVLNQAEHRSWASATVCGDTGGDGDIAPSVRVERAESSAEEARRTVGLLRLAHNGGVGWSGMAVLARTNAGLRAVALACAQAGIPTRSHRQLLQRPEVKAVLDDLYSRFGNDAPVAQVVGDLEQTADTLQRLHEHLRLTAEFLELPPDVLSEWRQSELADDVTVAELATELPDALLDGATQPAVGESLGELVELAGEYRGLQPFGRMDGLLVWLAAITESQGSLRAPLQPGVDLVTFHRAKGLEWNEVHVIGIQPDETDYLLDPPDLDDAAQAEERRLRYVALTRAKRQLRLSWHGPAGSRPPAWIDAAAEAASGLAVPRRPAPAAQLAAWRASSGPAANRRHSE